jgi:hypothetical protein
MCCAYCHRQATTKIVGTLEQVCADHATEFWTGLLAYVRDRAAFCVKQERFCTCRSCKEFSEVGLRAVAIAVAGPSPPDPECFPIRVASSSIPSHVAAA